MMAAATENTLPVTLSYIGCWYKNDMYSTQLQQNG